MKNWGENIYWWYAFLLILVAYAAGLCIDLTGDAGLYAAITRQMVESGNWINLQINGEPYDQKPHLLFWLAGIGVRLFGNTNFAFKLFPALYGWLGFYFTFKLGETLYNRETGKLAALLAATSQIFFLYSFDIHTDIALQTGVTLALWQLAVYLKNQKPVNFIFGFIGVGLAMLAKGPVGAVLPFFAVLFYLFAEKDFRQLFHYKWLLGGLISLIIIIPTLLHLHTNFGWQGIEFYFITNNFGRISGEYAGSSRDPFFYLYNSVWMFLPWTIFVFYAVFSEVKYWFTAKTNLPGIYLLGSVLTFLIIISIARGKAPNYFFMAVPPVLVIAAGWMNKWRLDFTGRKTLLLKLQWIFLALLTTFLLFAVIFYGEVNLRWFYLISALSFGAFLFGITKIRQPFEKITLASLLFVGLFNLYLNTTLVPHLAQYQGASQANKLFEEFNKPGDKLYNFELQEYELLFLANNAEEIRDWDHLFEVMEIPGTWLYTTPIKYNDIIQMDYNIDTIYVIEQRGLNQVNLQFLNPKTRPKSLQNNYLIRTKSERLP